jgi:hypothetical protein
VVRQNILVEGCAKEKSTHFMAGASKDREEGPGNKLYPSRETLLVAYFLQLSSTF